MNQLQQNKLIWLLLAAKQSAIDNNSRRIFQSAIDEAARIIHPAKFFNLSKQTNKSIKNPRNFAEDYSI